MQPAAFLFDVQCFPFYGDGHAHQFACGQVFQVDFAEAGSLGNVLFEGHRQWCG